MHHEVDQFTRELFEPFAVFRAANGGQVSGNMRGVVGVQHLPTLDFGAEKERARWRLLRAVRKGNRGELR